MNFLRGIVKWIALLESDNDQYRKMASILLKTLGVLALICTIVWGIAICVSAIGASDHLATGERTIVIIGAILVLGINVIMGPILIMLFWNRSKLINALGEDSHITSMPVPTMAILIKVFGEVGFLILVGIGIQGLVLSIFGTEITAEGMLTSFLNPEQLISGEFTDINVLSLVISLLSSLFLLLLPNHFMMGVLSLVISVLGGILLLIFHYFLAELINQFVDMGLNLRKIETTLSVADNPSDS